MNSEKNAIKKRTSNTYSIKGNNRKNNIKSNINSNNKRNDNKNGKKKKKNNKKAKIVFTFISILVIIILLIVFLLKFEAFNLKNVTVSGTDRYDSNTIVTGLNITYGNNIFKEMYKISKKDYSIFPYIEKMNVNLNSASSIELNVKERVSKYIAFDKENNKYYRLDDNGYILEECKVTSKSEDEIILIGVSFDENVILGSKVSDVYLKKIDSYLQIKEKFESSNLKEYGNITKVKFDNAVVTLVIEDKLSIVLQNDSNLDYNLTLLKGILQNIPKDSTGKIDMTKENPVYSTY